MSHRDNMHDFRLFCGDTKAFPFGFENADGSSLDITGHELWLTIKRLPDDLDADAVLQRRIVFQPPDSVKGEGTFVLDSNETGMVNPGIYFYDFQWVAMGDPPVVFTLLAGRIYFNRDITRRNRM